MSTFFEQREVLRPEEVSTRERIFERDGVLRWLGSSVIGRAKIGVTLQTIVNVQSQAHRTKASVRLQSLDLEKLLRVYQDEDYVLWYSDSTRLALIALKDGASGATQLKAWSQALMVAHKLIKDDATSAKLSENATLMQLSATLRELSTNWADTLAALKVAGWAFDTANLETTSSTRIRFRSNFD
ncbi:hypothetical protein MMC13_001891 [Lambiella insularis]|nr:hypothetical protein [Lambiella insularis]